MRGGRMDLGLRGKVALVTGASRGIGKAIAQTLINEGCRVAICARDGEQLRKAVAELSHGKKATTADFVIGLPTDVTDDAAVQNFVATSHKLSLIHISEPTRLGMISYAVFCLKKKK